MTRLLSVLTITLALAFMALAPGSTALATNPSGTLTVNNGLTVTGCPGANFVTTFKGSGLAADTDYDLRFTRLAPLPVTVTGNLGVTTDNEGGFTVAVSTVGAPAPSTFSLVVILDEVAKTNAVTVEFLCEAPPPVVVATPVPTLPPCPTNVPGPLVGCIFTFPTPTPIASPTATPVPTKAPPVDTTPAPRPAPTVAAATATPARIATLPSTTTGSGDALWLLLVAIGLATLSAGAFRLIRR